jgi:hypothetical protein
MGKVSLEETGTKPFFYFMYQDVILKRDGVAQGQCAETNGDCHAFVNKYLNIKFI